MTILMPKQKRGADETRLRPRDGRENMIAISYHLVESLSRLSLNKTPPFLGKLSIAAIGGMLFW